MKPIRTLLLVTGVALVLAACGGATTTPTPEQVDADVTVVSTDMKFDQSTITLTAGEATTMLFVNEDSMPHNVAIYTDSSASEVLFEGDMVTDDTIVYEIPAMEPGEYFFRCDLHPDMTGTIVVEG